MPIRDITRDCLQFKNETVTHRRNILENSQNNSINVIIMNFKTTLLM